MKQKCFFFDIDGTLNNGIDFYGGIPQSAIEAIAQLRENQHYVAIATGRPYASAKVMADQVGIDHIVCNGGYASYAKGVCLESRALPKQDCLQVIESCQRQAIPFCVSRDDTFRFYAKDDRFLHCVSSKEFHGEYAVIPDLHYPDITEIHRILIALSRKEEQRIQDFGCLVPSRYHESYLIVEPDDKFHGICTMMKHWQRKMEDVVVFGDGRNDVSMFQQAAFSIAMGNGVEEAKQQADFVTKRSDEDGLAYALKHFGWIS